MPCFAFFSFTDGRKLGIIADNDRKYHLKQLSHRGYIVNQKERFKKTVAVTLFIIACGMALIWMVRKGPLDMSCKIYRTTGYSCSGCGTTRMVEALMRGRWYQAFRYNPFIALSIPMGILCYGIGAYRYIRYNAENDWVNNALIVYAVLLAAFGVIRNLPLLEWLLPTTIY